MVRTKFPRKGKRSGTSSRRWRRSIPGVKARLCDDQGEIRSFVNMYVNGEDVRFLDGLGTSVSSGDEVSIVPAVAGG